MIKIKNFIGKIIVIFCMALMFGILVHTNVLAADSTSIVPKKDYSANLIANYKFNETSGTTCIDSKSTYNGTYIGTTSITENGETFRRFNGTSDYVKFSNKSMIPIGKKSIKFRLKNNLIKTDAQCIVDTCGAGNIYNGISLYVYNGFLYAQGFYANSASANFTLKSTYVLSDNQWHDVLFTWDGTTNTDSVKLYIDDLIIPNVKSTAIIPEVNAISFNPTIGKSSSASQYYFQGDLDNMEIYNDVIEYEAKSTAISLDKTSIDLTVGSTDNLVYTITPDNSTNDNVTWTSSDPTIATVDENGQVTALKEGTATITVKTTDGSDLSASCTVNVISESNSRGKLTITMMNGVDKQYDLSMAEIDSFIKWYDNRANGTGASYYTFIKTTDVAPFIRIKQYVIFDKIVSFDISEYNGI